MSLFELAYVSTVALGTSDETIDDLVKHSELNNSLADVSGLLLFNGINFAQILEGPEATVAALYEKIKLDDRHTGVIKLSWRPIGSRTFSGWSMAYLKSTDSVFGPQSRLAQALNSREDLSQDREMETILSDLKTESLARLAGRSKQSAGS